MHGTGFQDSGRAIAHCAGSGDNLGMTLTAEQVAALKHGEPVRLRPPELGAECVVLRADVYERIQTALDDSLSAEQVGVLVERVMRDEDQGDPLLDSYQQYRR
jgi:hypothetical protein